VRGTGWRGLVPFGNTAIRRPFTDIKPMNKADILRYATEHNLSFRQDPTNTEDRYLRNRLREKLRFFDNGKKSELTKIYHRTYNLRDEVDDIVCEILQDITSKNGEIERKLFYDLDNNIALEILRAALLRAGVSATRPQILDFLNAIKTYHPGKYFNLPGDKLVKINKHNFVI